ncbi:hypothetical protein [Streptomyces sp. NPDC046976]
MRDGAFHRIRRDGYEICFVPDAGVPSGDYTAVFRDVGPEDPDE